MRNSVKRAVMAAALLAWAGAASAQTADDVIDKAVKALGGREALGKVTSRSMNGTMVVSTPNGDLNGTIEVLNQAPNKVRTLVSLDLSAVGMGTMTIDQRFDGASAYAMDSMQGVRPLSADQLANMKNADFPSPLLNYKERGTKIEMSGKEKAGERDAIVLAVTPKEGPPSRLFIDAESFLPIRTVATVELPEMGRVEQTTDLSDYREVDGVKVPFSIHNTSAVQSFTVTVTKVEHNTKIDPALFSKPSEKD